MASSGALSRSRYLLEQERKKEEEEKRRVAHAAKIFEEKAKKIEAVFEVTRLKRAEAQREELEIEVRLQREKYQRDKIRAEEVKLHFQKQKEATRQHFLKDILWRKQCYTASLQQNFLPFEPSLSGILMSCSVEPAYSSVGSKNSSPVPSNVLRHVRALFPQVAELEGHKVQSVDDLVKEIYRRSMHPTIGPRLTKTRHVIYITIIGECPEGWGEALLEFCKAWFASAVPVKLIKGICPSHRWGNILKRLPPPSKEQVEEAEGIKTAKEAKMELVLPPVKKSSDNSKSDRSLFVSDLEVDLFEAHDYLGRSLRENPNIKDGAILIAFTLSDVLNPKSQAKIAAQIASNRVRPRFVTESVAQEAKQAHEEEIEHANNLKEYAKVIMPTPTTHWSYQSIDPAQRTGVVSLFPPKHRKEHRRRRQSDTAVEEDVPPLTSYSWKGSDEVFRSVLGSIPTCSLSMLGMQPCAHGYDCSHRSPLNQESRGVLHNCPVCLAKMTVLCGDCKSAFSPIARERLLLSCFSTNPILKRIRGHCHDSLEWSRSLMSAVELEVFGSEADASAAYAAWKKCTPKHFEVHRHKFKSMHGEGPISAQRMVEYEQSLNRNMNNNPCVAPPYPSEKRVEQPRQRPDNILEKDVAKLDPWRAGPDMIWTDHSLVVRSKSVEALPKEYWIDPLKTRFGGISEGRHPPRQIVNKFEPVEVVSTSPNQAPERKYDFPGWKSMDESDKNMNVSEKFVIKRAGGMYSYGSFELERARILPTESDESVRSHPDELASLGSPKSLRSQGSIRSPKSLRSQGSIGIPKSPLKAKLKRKKSKRMK